MYIINRQSCRNVECIILCMVLDHDNIAVKM